eukprot:TRINITY_DN10494_c0_g1_i1.p1 TRINITY_DN10494_c0_g1~~TRINITY_DN10494_c0_g1_i1.p1  ORF type:complete len:436 (-),score=59.43 TRINITY_DN10494_c0_g1_i1:61-1368(-)
METVLPRTGPSAVVLEFGSAYVKCGFAGEAQPRAFVPAHYFHTNNATQHDTNPLDGTPGVAQPTEEEWCDALVSFVHNLYFFHLQVNPHERAVVLCESLVTPRVFRQALAHVLFNVYHAPSVLYLSSDAVTTLPLRRNTALIVDAGNMETRVIPLFEDALQTQAFRTALLAGRSIHTRLAHLLKQRSQLHRPVSRTSPELLSKTVDSDALLSRSVLEDIKVRLCEVPTRPLAAEEPEIKTVSEEHSGDLKYHLNSDAVLTVDKYTRQSAPQVLFELDEEEESVATVVLDSLLQCPYDTRCRLAQNILPIGGTSMLKGYTQRLVHELNTWTQHTRYSELRGLTGQFAVISSPFPSNIMGWLGGSVVGCVEHKEAITLKQFQENSPLPDWMRILDAREDVKGKRSKKPFELTPTPFTTTGSTAALSAYISSFTATTS